MVVKRILRKVLRRKKKTKDSDKEDKHKVLRSWEDLYSDLQEHPLTQAKLLNEQLFHATNESLKEINEKLDNLDERVSSLESRKARKAPKKDDFDNVKRIIPKAQLSDHERAIIEFIEKHNETDAQTIAQTFNISRGNASLKLNKLYSWSYLTKRLDEKSVFFRIK
jgi:hypothetical protein|tara:strand:+ start:873 stop:1370 length:498 start_codon:yes stop_codon:yes gene_type:complete